MENRLNLFRTYLNRSQMEHKKYQYEGVEWILAKELQENPTCKVRGGIIADEMGLGKTIMMIGTFVCNFLPKTLIIVPPVLLNQWYEQILQTTGHRALIYHGVNKKKITIEMLNKSIIVITTYGAITMNKKKMDPSLLHHIKWSRLVIDEAHNLRNSKSIRAISVKKLQGKIRWFITGTPIQNSQKDLFSLYSLMRLHSNDYYKNYISVRNSYILKRTKAQVGILLPDVISDKNIVHWKSTQEMKLSEEIHSALQFSKVSNHKYLNSAFTQSFGKGGPLSLLIRARQSCIYPRLLSRVFHGSDFYKEAFSQSSKLDYVVNKILQRKDNNCGKLIFCQFREEIDEVARRLIAGGVQSVATFDGRTSKTERFQILKSKKDALILQIQTGCEGLNLQQHYSEIYFVSPHWNPAVEDQAIARCHRIGQTKVVHVERFEMSKFVEENTLTVDSYVVSVQNKKRIIACENL
jgi:SNF2 family DNA or RNA helicase